MPCFYLRPNKKTEKAIICPLYLFGLLCLLWSLAVAACVQNSAIKKTSEDPNNISFRSTHPKDSNFAGTRLITGRLIKPAGDGPFPAVVLLHGCNGISARRDSQWVDRLNNWGYVTLQVDSLGPRGIDSVCTYRRLESLDIVERRVQDAYDARAYLAAHPLIDKNKIAVMGWSHGGLTTLEVLLNKQVPSFRAGVALYPLCSKKLTGLNAPLLILIGSADDWTPAKACEAMMPANIMSSGVTLQVYKGAHHGFDTPGANMDVMGAGGVHHLQYDQAAESDAIIRVRDFLGKNLQ